MKDGYCSRPLCDLEIEGEILDRVSGHQSPVFSDCNALNKMQFKDSVLRWAVVAHTLNLQGTEQAAL